VVVEMVCEPGPQRVLRMRTNVDDWVGVDARHPLRFSPAQSGGLKPYVRVRDDLWALVKRAVFYDLVDLGETRAVAGERMFGIGSAGVFFPMAPADEIEALL